MRESMEIYPGTAAERTMKLQKVLLRATGKIKWWQAEESIGNCEDATMGSGTFGY
jgi:hypothetical protein